MRSAIARNVDALTTCMEETRQTIGMLKRQQAMNVAAYYRLLTQDSKFIHTIDSTNTGGLTNGAVADENQECVREVSSCK